MTQEGNGYLVSAKLVGKIPHLPQFSSSALERDIGHNEAIDGPKHEPISQMILQNFEKRYSRTNIFFTKKTSKIPKRHYVTESSFLTGWLPPQTAHRACRSMRIQTGAR